jgi:hypothetical protein
MWQSYTYTPDIGGIFGVTQMNSARAMLEVRTITECPLRESELILIKTDIIGFHDLGMGSLIYRTGIDTYEIIQYVKGYSGEEVPRNVNR